MTANHSTSSLPAVGAAPTSDPTRKKFRLRWLALGIVPVLVLGGAATAQAHKSVELEINGQRHTLSTFAGSVDGLLAEQGITVGDHDLLAPGGDTALKDGTDVVVRTGREVAVTVGGQEQKVWTTALTSGEVVASLADSGRDVFVAASRSLEDGRQPLDMPLVVDGPVDVVADGNTNRVQLEGTAYVTDALKAAGVTTENPDRVEIRPGADGTAQVVVTRVERTERQETQPVDFATVQREDASLYKGQSKVVQEGLPGERTLTFATVIEDGTEVRSEQTGDEITRAPVDRVVAVGTTARPAPAATGGAAPAAPAPALASGDVWARLAQCESGGNPRAVSANGLYHGLYQFSVQTWQAMGGAGLPSQAAPGEQTQRAQALQARSGWGQWPACAAKLGLR
ncbi:resuscitation-promoting factor [Georgenia ruanii]|uniref:resuscitation-promoting factor n=1 Tax=Georgenia ruanii TaxID=348442 RepID=UPI00126524E1|nr:resuscitation-promoting factor [Georgenia ruanii]